MPTNPFGRVCLIVGIALTLSMRCEAQINTGTTALQSHNDNVTVPSPPTLKMVAAKAQEVICMTPEVLSVLRENDISCNEYISMEESKQFYIKLYEDFADTTALFMSLGRILCFTFILPIFIGFITSIGLMLQGERLHKILSSASTLPQQHKTKSNFTLYNVFFRMLAHVCSTRLFQWLLNRIAMHFYNTKRPRDDPVIRKYIYDSSGKNQPPLVLVYGNHVSNQHSKYLHISAICMLSVAENLYNACIYFHFI